jgi:hypothetical protein
VPRLADRAEPPGELALKAERDGELDVAGHCPIRSFHHSGPRVTRGTDPDQFAKVALVRRAKLSRRSSADFCHAFLGRIRAIELMANYEVGSTSDQLYLRAIIRSDFALAHTSAFVVCDNLVVPS